jgi:signal transduction histidine kinase
LIGREAYDFVPPTWLEWVRVVVLAFSFASLCAFGLRMRDPFQQRSSRDMWVAVWWLCFYGVGILEIGAWLDWSVAEWIKATDVWTRYTLGVPGALLAAWGLLIQRRIFLSDTLTAYAGHLRWAALAFASYGVIGQGVTSPSRLFPSTVINTQSFLDTLGVPIQLFRALMAGLIAVFIIRALRGFDEHRRRQLTAAQRTAQEAVARRDALRGELLRRSVSAQEEDRKRIARELHDEIGQTLSGLAAGLRGVQQSLNGDVNRVGRQLQQLEQMTTRAIDELSYLVADLRPSLLDDMGLSAALGWYVEQVNRRGPTRVELVIEGPAARLPPDVETTFFRITQEALTNVIRHAQAKRAEVTLVCEGKLARLRISDDGKGFDPASVMADELRSGWGLAGVQERVQLVGGACHIESAPGHGTTVTVEIPLFAWKEKDNGAHQADVG